MKIAKIEIGRAINPFIIAEMSSKHDKSLGCALALVHAVADAGSHAVALQTFNADTMKLDVDETEFLAATSYWRVRQKLHKFDAEAYTPWEWRHGPIMQRAKE